MKAARWAWGIAGCPRRGSPHSTRSECACNEPLCVTSKEPCCSNHLCGQPRCHIHAHRRREAPELQPARLLDTRVQERAHVCVTVCATLPLGRGDQHQARQEAAARPPQSSAAEACSGRADATRRGAVQEARGPGLLTCVMTDCSGGCASPALSSPVSIASWSAPPAWLRLVSCSRLLRVSACAAPLTIAPADARVERPPRHASQCYSY